MTGMLLYFALGLLVLTVLSNRYWRGQLHHARTSLAKLKESVDAVTAEVAEVAKEYASLSHTHAQAETRAAKAEQELAQALFDVEAKRAAPVERYHVLDRQEPRPGRFFEAVVRHIPLSGDERPAHRAWIGARRYLLVAETEREARERLADRFPRQRGFELVEVTGCRLAALKVNRIAELSTFRKPGAEEDVDEKPRRRAPSIARP